MEQFGNWANQSIENVPVPVGKECIRCGIPIKETDRGVVMIGLFMNDPEDVYEHRECLLESLFGPLWRSRFENLRPPEAVSDPPAKFRALPDCLLPDGHKGHCAYPPAPEEPK